MPVLPADTETVAESRAGPWPDHRVIHTWDGTGEVTRQFARRLSLKGPGWDLYLIYGRGIRWEDDLLPLPAFWMHQLSPAVGTDPALCLSQDPGRLGRVVDALYARDP